MPRLPGHYPVPSGEGRGAARGSRAVLPALFLPPLRGAAANLPAMGPRKHRLRRECSQLARREGLRRAGAAICGLSVVPTDMLSGSARPRTCRGVQRVR